MIQISPHMRILLAVEPVDFRAGIDGLVALIRKRLQSDPFGGGLFVFRNRKRTAIKIIHYDTQGFWMCQKRLSSGRFGFWPQDTTTSGKDLTACELQVLLMGGDPDKAKTMPPWRHLSMAA
jgi:transposase